MGGQASRVFAALSSVVLCLALSVWWPCLADPIATKESRMPEIAERIASTPFPRIGTTWHAVRGDRSDASLLRHDLVITGPHWYGLRYDEKPGDVPERFTPESMARARERVAAMRRLHPHAVLIASIAFFEYSDLSDNHPWYLRWNEAQHKEQWWYKRRGDLVQFWPGTYRMDLGNLDYQARIVAQIREVREAGLDGVFIDNLGMAGMALTKGVDERPAWIGFFKKIREACGDDFLLIANGGLLTPWAAPYLNGAMFEGLNYGADTDWDQVVGQMQEMVKAQPEPHVDYLERFERTGDDDGWPGDPERGLPPATRDPAARRWSLALALTVGDYYYLFSDSTHHAHDWYSEYDLKIGLPLGPGERVNSHVWRRHYEKGLVVVNLPGAAEPYQADVGMRSLDSFTGERGTRFSLPPGDGRILIPLERLGG